MTSGPQKSYSREVTAISTKSAKAENLPSRLPYPWFRMSGDCALVWTSALTYCDLGPVPFSPLGLS